MGRTCLGCRLGCCSLVGSAQHRPRREPRPAPGRSPPGCRPPRHALRRAQPCLVAESLCALTKNREASVCSPLHFWQGQKDLNPRHAVLEWMWENTTGSREKPVLPGSRRKLERGWCWFGAAGKNPAQSTSNFAVEKTKKKLFTAVSLRLLPVRANRLE